MAMHSGKTLIRPAALAALLTACAGAPPAPAPLPVPVAAAQAPPSCASYADELTAMRDAAEEVRARVNFEAPPEDAGAARLAEQLEQVERTNALRLLALLESCGWPRPEHAGERAGALAWALAQPASTDLRFQKKLLSHLHDAVAHGEAPARYLAITADRVALLEERPQPYGTQLRPVDACSWNYYPLDDRIQVEARRKAAGLAPLDDYKRGINAVIEGENCRTPLPIPAAPNKK